MAGLHIFTNVTLFMLTVLLTGCALSPKEKRVMDVSIESERIHFTGKGAGAGMMLSSSLGPMGIAVGIAIDEGIAKEIHQAFESEQGELAHFIRDTVNSKCAQVPSTVSSFRFDRIGFHLPSSGDRAQLSLTGSVDWAGGERDIESLLESADLQSEDLSELKTNGALVANQIEQGIQEMCSQLLR